MRGRRTTKESFFAQGVRVGECLIWPGDGRVGPYGVAGYRGKHWLAHRLAYHLATGEEIGDDVIRHSCDVPLCIEPDHLSRGTHQDNVDDKVSRDRHRHHSSHPMAKLTEEDVQEIRSRRQQGVLQRQLADDYGVTRQQISKITLGQRWSA